METLTEDEIIYNQSILTSNVTSKTYTSDIYTGYGKSASEVIEDMKQEISELRKEVEMLKKIMTFWPNKND